jgi:hypothetical protein
MQLMPTGIDIFEDNILDNYPNVLETLLLDQTTKKNIFWATDNYKDLGNGYDFFSPITIDLITRANGNVIMPRVLKNKLLQQKRIKNMAEVYTPSWVCNEQNNLVDFAWFGRKNVFNKRVFNSDGSISWEANSLKIIFPKGKSWKDYVRLKALEVSCGEAPYITSRYDTTSGEYIPVKNRIGLLDRKLRVISENVNNENEWISIAELAYKSIYGYEWQGDSLLLARESLFFTFLEYYIEKFDKDPPLKSLQNIAKIISWNIWQMDGLKGVIPRSCHPTIKKNNDLFGNIETNIIQCMGCQKDDIHKHNGVYCLVKEWAESEKSEVKFIDLINE